MMESEITYRHLWITPGLMNDPVLVGIGFFFVVIMIIGWLYFEYRNKG